MQKPPVGFRGDTGVGALTGLSGVGPQEQFLYDFDSKREYTYNEYSQATPFYRFYRPATSTFLGEEIRYTFNPRNMGDLLTGLMLKFNFPPTTGTSVTCLRNLGLSMIKRVDFIVNGKTIQTLRGDWLSIYESMYSSEQERENIFNVSYNLGATFNTQPTLEANDTSQRLFFPLPFFFNNHYVDARVDTTSFRASLPLCAMHNSEITLVIRFLPLAEIVSDVNDFATGADLTDFMFVTEEVTLTPSERFMLRSTKQKYPIEKVSAEEVEIDATENAYYRYFFNSIYSCRAIFWTFRNNISGYNPFFYKPLINARITTLNKTDRNELRETLFLQELQASIHDYYNDGSFYGYSFSEQPLQVVVGDYEFRAPRPQSSYIDMFFTTTAPGYNLWSGVFGASTKNYELNSQFILLNTSVGLDRTTNALLSLKMNTDGYLRTNSARVGIGTTSYTETNNYLKPYMMRFEPWNGTNEGYIKITPSARTNINTFVATIESYLITIYYLSTNILVVENGLADVIETDVGNGIIEGKFNSLDTDASGFIEAIEFDVSTYDRDGDGKISFAEFKEIEEV